MTCPDSETFSHIRRVRDHRFPHEVAQILPGEYFVSKEPMVVYTVLGSCISVCVLDPVLRIGGMNHFMLPAPKNSQHDSWGESARYGSFAMELLINEILKRGGQKKRLVVKIFGGANLFKKMGDVGLNNTKWAIDYLKMEGLRLINSDIGDVYPRKIYYFTETGQVLMKKIERIRNETIFERERKYGKKLAHQKEQAVDVTLF